ncbi:hypothetical protein T310_0231 [Rasamsonia emersonii CBS 393.64]|uniref:AB hydrolase-1 domain-containing protein n=1 Tax=Rasamsonia emersonii (strain ATCC 16479 / CBS 393.64 / IMI 116815) TaxID=1408163 RepID=A0A0F4Z7C1_RASE3|nr:hypothetical protein T310_0231 [Rasamsonia emersonii CBS 393.64]KKA25753.1 hypothetical protein T310_0231 [Rasamsonia emersonii CBS 393.64]
MEGSFTPQPSSLSRKTYHIAGIQTTVFGLDELPPQSSEVACLWLLHPRLQTQEYMTKIATSVVDDWNKRLKDGGAGARQKVKGLIAVTFDQRNHGTRQVDPLANEAWKQGNPRHAQDMFSIFQGTARDVSLLIDYLPAYIFPKSEYSISTHLALGVSLGGHATWSCLFHEPRIRTGISIIGSPDYINLLADRARLSKLSSWTNSDPQAATLLLSHTQIAAKDAALKEGPLPDPSEQDKERLRPLLTRTLAGKWILNISGGADKLVPYYRSEPILTWLKKAIAPGGWFADGGIHFEDLIFEKAGHELTGAMMDEVIRFVAESLSAPDDVPAKVGVVREAKI